MNRFGQHIMQAEQMKKKRISFVLPMVIALVSMPAVLSLLYFKLTGDPTLRPLGVTQASLAEHDAAFRGYAINVQINWGNAANAQTSRARVRNALSKALDVYAIDYQIRINDVEGNRVEVYYIVSNSRIGPYQLHNIATGIPAALAAYQMSSGG